MSRTSKTMWEVFTETGNIEVYLSYKRKKEKEENKWQKTQSKLTQ